MNGLSAVIFIPDDTAKNGYPQPTMLYPLMGVPMLTWLSHSLFESGIGRFFLVCHEQYLSQAKACLPAQAEVMTSAASNPVDQLHVFLSTADDGEQEVTIIAGPTLYLPMVKKGEGCKDSAAFRMEREALMDALDTDFSFSRLLHDQATPLHSGEGFFSADSPTALPELTRLLRQDQILGLRRRGVEIFDPDNCYIAPTVRIEQGVRLLPGTILQGNSLIRAGSSIGPWSRIEDSEIGEGSIIQASFVSGSRVAADTFVGPFAHLTPGSELSRGVQIGSFVETRRVTLGEATLVAPLSILSDGEIGSGCMVGSGTVTASFDRLQTHKTQIGDQSFIGCNSSLIAPVALGNGAYVGAGSVITEDIPENGLGIARSRQGNKKDWAAKHKQPL